MFIVTKQAVLIYSPDRKQTFKAPNGYMGAAPDWLSKAKQFQRMVKVGTIVVNAKKAEKPKADEPKE